MNWVQRKIYLYNVTFGLFMLDWWERCLFSILFYFIRSDISIEFKFASPSTLADILVIVLMWFIFYNGSRYVTDFCKSDCDTSPTNCN
ncbi:hypothetical protein NC652_007702 [Populus alba x Populus x berolinensis]|nr:hypothetical protein NC652_007702 [Populus alba x Populus x berolinensis]